MIQGRDGWLFLGDDISIRCKTKAIPDDIVARMKRLSDVVTNSGRKFVIMIAPDKTTIYPRYLPKSYVGRACTPPYTTRFWSAFEKNPTPGNVDVRTLLLDQAWKSDSPIYGPKDSHWDLQGISLEAALLAEPSTHPFSSAVMSWTKAPIVRLVT